MDDNHAAMMPIEPDDILCPKCGSRLWVCYDESYTTFEDASTGELFELPIGSLKCEDCKHGFVHHDWYGEDGKRLIWLGW